MEKNRLYYIITVWLVYQQLCLNGSKACFSMSVLYCGYCIIMLLYSLPRRLFLQHHHYGLFKVATLNTSDSFSIRHSIPFQSYSFRHKKNSNIKAKEEKQGKYILCAGMAGFIVMIQYICLEQVNVGLCSFYAVTARLSYCCCFLVIDLSVSPSPRTRMSQWQSSISSTGSGTRTS